MPAWLEKWAALLLAFVEEEQRLLPAELLTQAPPLLTYTPETAAFAAKGSPCCPLHPWHTCAQPLSL